jgi:hypothetical protein
MNNFAPEQVARTHQACDFIIATASASVSVAAAGAFRRLRNVPRGLVLENDDSNLSQNRLKRTMSTVRRVASHGAKSAPP